MRYLLSAVLATALVGPVWVSPVLADAGTISVTGHGTVAVVPDMATLDIGVTTNGDTAAAALAANNEALTQVIARLITAKVSDRDLQTSNLSLNPNWVMTADGLGQEVKGYIASNILTVRIRDLATVGAVLDAAVQDGANTLNGLSFGLADDSEEQDAAKKAAVADAMARAKLLAEAAGTKLGAIVSITEGAGYQPPMPMASFKAEGSPVPVLAGEIGVQSDVTIMWELAE
ncbi:SIMPL domain-containing protein [Rhodobacter sp. KR11]|uniref:SIMPL domain-containing protein n=1 Tax=Rhodobacter sp. KR11 TaxID=2974588 RepID=UPI0022237E52|nr:SIMPL domain-containing protein [Rhodobacter sp. KR11]MCW1919868.1 SIMPL domain-containing protein [Rhodobacter sp. KR11]